LSKSKWGDQIPHLERLTDGAEQWSVDGHTFPLVGGGSVGACLKDPSSIPQRWEDVPSVCYQPRERLTAMDTDGAAYSVLYPMVAGIAGEVFGRIKDAELEIACVRAYNDWIVEEWASASNRFLPQCLVPLSSVAAAVEEARRAGASSSLRYRAIYGPSYGMSMIPSTKHSGALARNWVSRCAFMLALHHASSFSLTPGIHELWPRRSNPTRDPSAR
jgi:hypothetical protein